MRSRWSRFSPLSRRLGVAAAGLTALSALLNGVESLLHAAPDSPLSAAARVFDVVSDGTAPTWYSSFLLLLTAALLLQVIRLSDKSPGTTSYRAHLIVLAIGLLYMSIDETARIHEQLNEPVREWLHLGGAFEYAWVVVAIPLVAIIGVAYRPWVVGLPAHVRRLVVTGGVVFSLGAVGLEMVAAAFLYGQNATRLAGLISHGEELAEMLGVVIFIEAMIRHLADLAWDGALRLEITSRMTQDAQQTTDRTEPETPGRDNDEDASVVVSAGETVPGGTPSRARFDG